MSLLQLNRSNLGYILAVVGFVAAGMSLYTCNGYKQSNTDAYNYITAVKDTLKYSHDSVLASKRVVEADAQLFKKILEERDDLKAALVKAKIKPSNVSSIATVISVSTKKPARDSIVLHHTTILHDTVIRCPETIPAPPDTLSLITSTEYHLFKSNVLKLSATHSDKDIRTIGLENLAIREKHPWWQSGWIKVGAGLIGGYALFHR